jgi:anion-transporting  ArsA/GET3 family ATPase
MKNGHPFAVLVARGDDTTSSLDVIEVPVTEQPTDVTDAARAAMLYALRVLGLDPSRLAEEGFEEPVMVLDEIADETTFQELQQGWAMKLLAPDDHAS